jgi:hypothetical protein
MSSGTILTQKALLLLAAFAVCAAQAASSPLPKFPTSWSAHESQYAHVSASVVKWQGLRFEDQTPNNHTGCKPPTSSEPRNCTATAYVDGSSSDKSTYLFFEPGEAIRGVAYFTFAAKDACYCDMVSLGRWVQCENADSLCNPNMLKKGVVTTTTLDGKPVDAIKWSESLIVASTKFTIYADAATATPVQYYTEYALRQEGLGYDQVNLTQFIAGVPDPSAFVVPGRVSGTCGDNICETYNENRKSGLGPIAAFPGWRGGQD